jgi:hypothetical protein
MKPFDETLGLASPADGSRPSQIPTEPTTAREIMESPNFAQGLDDVRNGLPFDWRIDDWNYERGRCFGCIAPLHMALRIGNDLNPRAVALLDAAFDRNLVI